MATWRDLIEIALRERGETWADIQSITLTPTEIDTQFDDGFGGSQGRPFTAWTAKYVYFPVVYDGSEWVGSAPRNPCDEPTQHQGGE